MCVSKSNKEEYFTSRKLMLKKNNKLGMTGFSKDTVHS